MSSIHHLFLTQISTHVLSIPATLSLILPTPHPILVPLTLTPPRLLLHPSPNTTSTLPSPLAPTRQHRNGHDSRLRTPTLLLDCY
ncbi:hypothetical protein E2C01_045106 [Portunus trituberculatus]|uniref:Uncharacterized protein n=1 Tax=Portunus trituberculatus TaxID=210409 RepID=A0A5B7FUU6_PORTR|nr:hypothetical protein [Portunus trituberculatus]